MRTTINIRDELFKQLLSLTGAQSKTEAVNAALMEYVRLKHKEELIRSRGKIHVDESWRKLREMEKHER